MIFREPEEPNIHIFEFLQIFLLNLLSITIELLDLLNPNKIPDLSFKFEKINGNVIGREELNIFLLAMFFIIFELYEIGKVLLKVSSSLK